MSAEPVTASSTRRKLSVTLLVGSILVALVVLAALVSFVWTPFDPVQAVPQDRLQGSSVTHLMGTDRYGRDVFSGILYGARITLLVGLVAVGIALIIGTPLGILAGMRGGITEEVTMRGADILLAFPALLVAIMFGAVFGASTFTAMLAIGIGSIPGFARVARSGTLQVMSTEYIMAAKASSQSSWRIARRHVLPNIIGMVVVQCSVSFAIAVLAEAALSFLGLGTPPPVPSWGRMLQESQQFLGTFPMLAVWPGAAIAVAVLGFTLLGDGLRDRFDPKLNGDR
ncbi:MULTISPECIES: ABC transporter permease [Actinomycetes]|uniref:ABC transporter permease n=1 Tax=Actinomycetes TaxID=1760 RepID=UPI000CFDFA4A|nr:MULTISPECIES: ABC transporter permease [unclassified Arthrobacter]PQZ90424.1 peptide ABC transporter permease [Arthrobacter sp. MYb222]PRB75998.1 peptide ABC transporter permease [Arthrobacter sp. MYb214]TDU26205.1 peptide/nickel transport system permease protein [Arthrobacter sp. JUb115]